jgi:hypothetical protein
MSNSDRPADSVSKYTNPTSVPIATKIKISPTDPRNNALSLRQNPLLEVGEDPNIFVGDTPFNFPNLENYSNENLSTSTVYDYATPVDLTFPGKQILPTPENLLIKSDSFIIENETSVNSDGSINFVGTLTFDDIPGASGYDYIINAVAQ